MIEVAAQPFAAIDRVAAAEAEQRHRHVLSRAVDAIVERPGDQSCTGHRRHGLGEYPRRIETGDEGLRAHDIGDEAGRNLRHVAGACGRERQRAERRGGGEDEDQFLAGHDGLRLEGRPHEPDAASARSPDLENGLAEFWKRLADFEITLKLQ